MTTAMVKAYAKFNLTLDIMGRENGFHNLDSLVCTIDIYDTILCKKRKDALINVTMRGKGSETIPPERNNAVKAGEAFVKAFSTCGADIVILKDIPIGGGLGGSSADIAGVLNGLSRLYEVDDRARLKEIADSLGSDSGYLLEGGFSRLRGRGDSVEPLALSPTLHFLLLQPKTGVSAGEAFSAFDQSRSKSNPVTQRAIEALERGELETFGSLLKNDLQEPVCALNGDVKEALREGNAFSPLACCMTGSGSCVFLLFAHEELCRWAASRYRGKCRSRIVKSVIPGKRKESRSLYSLTEEEEALLKGD